MIGPGFAGHAAVYLIWPLLIVMAVLTLAGGAIGYGLSFLF